MDVVAYNNADGAAVIINLLNNDVEIRRGEDVILHIFHFIRSISIMTNIFSAIFSAIFTMFAFICVTIVNILLKIERGYDYLKQIISTRKLLVMGVFIMMATFIIWLIMTANNKPEIPAIPKIPPPPPPSTKSPTNTIVKGVILMSPIYDDDEILYSNNTTPQYV